MAKVSFYLFEKSPERQVDSTCRLCRKILRQPERIWLLCTDPALQQELDEKLWNF
ncbi:DNA polymerase III subunit chi, partial [Acinetobacter variabilis]|uniref:DNA polymerase III subunit chi n=1 Tax=Acinetobacter variabilis TaxID=70346 RepID=UPI003D768139